MSIQHWDKLLQRMILGSMLFAVATTPFLFNFGTSELFEFNKMLWIYAWTIVIGMLWLGRMIIGRRLLIKSTPLDLPITLFIISQIISTIFSIHPQTSIFGYYTRFHGGLLSTLSYIIWFYAAVTNLSFKHFKLLILTVLISGGLTAWYAIPEKFGASFSCLFATNEFSTECWSENTNPKYRIFGTFGQPNWLAAYLVTLLPLGLYQLTKTRQLLSGLGWLFWLGSATVAILFTKSRSGFLGLVVAISLFSLSWLWINRKLLKRKTGQKVKLFQYLVSGLALVAIIIAVCGSTFTPSLKNLLTKNETDSPTAIQEVVVRDPGGTDSGEIRKIVWDGAIKIWQRYPWIGSGVETFAYSYYQDRPMEHNLVSEWDFLYNKAHNEFLNFLATTGIIGLITYCLVLLTASWLVFEQLKNRSYENKSSLLSASLLVGIVGLSVTNFFGFSTVTVSLIMYLWLAGIMIVEEKEINNKSSAKNEKVLSGKINVWQWSAIVIMTFLIIFALNIIYQTWQADKNYAMGKNLHSLGQTNLAINYMLKAIESSPNQALYYNELSKEYASLAVLANQAKDTKLTETLVKAAVYASDTTLRLNPVHLNFYRNRAQVLASLVQIDETYLEDVRQTLKKAMELAPTDPKLVYNLARVEEADGQLDAAIQLYKKTVEFKPNYYSARQAYAHALFANQQFSEALIQIEQLELADRMNPAMTELKQKIEEQL